MTSRKHPALTEVERSAVIASAAPEHIDAIRRKSRSYAVFGGRRFEAEDLFHTALLNAYEGRPAWRAGRSIVDYCDEVMARRVGFMSATPKRKTAS
jgi:hypothetical protein